MKLNFNYKERDIEFDVVFSKRRTMEIVIKPPDNVSVKAPIGVPERIIIAKVKDKAEWIIKKLDYYKEMNFIPREREFINGETFMYLGEEYTLKIERNLKITEPKVELKYDSLIVTTADGNKECIKNALEKWYKLKAFEIITSRVKHFQLFFDFVPKEIRVKEQKRRWGSCTYDNKLLFNWRIVMANPDALDYVVVHEMSHMHHKNHSREYWKFVEAILPDYKIRSKWLKENGMRMEL